ncbi:MAG: alcohol dehydrogenase catalytic domain-containing protein [Alphaproteobacteria bacterium]|nr:alcohol dehydrogenase catalytic domain-containing protein [Alphaproteobacteria bacterium]
MKALVKNGNNVSLRDIDLPAAGDEAGVLIRIALAGLCRTDMEVAAGRIASKDPLVLGHEFSGIVEDVSAGVSGISPGDRVAVMPFLPLDDRKMKNGLPSYAGARMMGIDLDGAFSEFTVAPASAVYRLPDNVSLMEGAYMEPIAASMAVLNAVIAPGETGVIYGDNRISRLTERILNAKGFMKVSVCDREMPLAENSCDFIIETLATSEGFEKMVRAVRPGGRIILKSRQRAPVTFCVNDLVMKDITLEAVSYGDFQAGIDLVAAGLLRIDDLFGDVFALDRFETVFDLSRRGESKKLFFSAAGPDVWSH